MAVDDVVVRNEDYYMDHPEEFDALTEEERTQMLLGNYPTSKGETAEKDITAETEVVDEKAEKTAAPDADAGKVDDNKVDTAVKAEPVVQAKDGVHTIPYSELEMARKNAEHWEKVATEQAALMESLKAAQVEDKGTGDTKAQEAVMDALKQDYPELAGVLEPVMKSMIESGVKEQVSALQAELNKAIEPLKQSAEKLEKSASETAVEKHFNAIANAHSDYESVLASKEFDAWMNKQPTFAKSAIENVLEKGTASQVIELVTTYKAANPVKQEQTEEKLTAEQLALKAKQVTDNVKPGAPNSLSDVPAGSKAHHDEVEALLDMNNADLSAKFAGKTPAQIEEIISRAV